MSEDFERSLRFLRIIVLTLVGGAVVFAGTAMILRSGRPAEVTLLSTLAGGLAFFAIAMAAVVPALVVQQGRRQIRAGTFSPPRRGGLQQRLADDETGRGKLLLLYQTRTILAAAFLDGAALFNCTAYLVEGSTISLALGGLTLPLLIALLFPFPARVRRWIDVQERLLRRA